ncbi:MAG: PmoA family protein [Prosthecobacter sp.]|nr:PmoA family protein [Prosthecobacter sp.]
MKLTILLAATLALSLPAFAAGLKVIETDSEITLTNAGAPVLIYHKADVPPPPEADPVFVRSGFIHPLYTPKGGVVTGIHPKDHYHHLGLWHAWVHGEHEGKPVDFWNLKALTGRVKFAKTIEIKNAGDSAGFTVEQEAIRYRDGKGGDAIVLLREQLQVTGRLVDGAYELDYDITQKNITEQPLVLTAYRYGGGIAYRAPLDWNKDNSDYLTSEGKTRKDSHTTRARWVAMHGPTAKGDATVTVFGHAKNHDAPQHLRTWDDGKIFFNYVPIQETPWEIKAGETITQRYRLIIADTKPDAKDLDARWQRYAQQ